MPKVNYDLSGVEDMPDIEHAPVGMYIGKIEAVDARDSSKGNPMLEVRWILTHNADGTRLKTEYNPLWDYPLLQHENKFVMKRTADFFRAIKMKLKGALDTDKMVGKKAQLKLKSDTDEDGEYRPRIGKIMPLDADPGDAPAAEAEPEPEAEEDGAVDLDALDRDGLKAFIREQSLGTLKDLGINSKTTDDQIRTIIADTLGGGEGEPETEPEEEPEPEPEEEPEEEGVDLDALDRDALKAFIRENNLGTLADLGINKATTDAEIRTIIVAQLSEGEPETEPEEEPEPEAEPEAEPESGGEPEDDGYGAMSPADLKAEIKERELPLPKPPTKPNLIATLRADDGSNPF